MHPDLFCNATRQKTQVLILRRQIDRMQANQASLRDEGDGGQVGNDLYKIRQQTKHALNEARVLTLPILKAHVVDSIGVYVLA